jgi:hypothetical protein
MALPAPAAAKNKNTFDTKDSVFSWGPWAHVAPAAGPQGVGFLSFGGPFQYQSELTVANEGPCNAGETCGFATYQFGRDYCYDGAEHAPIPAVIGLSWGLGGGEGAYLTPNWWPTFHINHHDRQYCTYALADFTVQGLEQPGTYPQQTSAGGYSFSKVWAHSFEVYNYSCELGSSEIEATLIASPDLLAGYWSRSNPNDDQPKAWGYFVYGTTTSAADMQALNAGNVTATYCGVTGFGNNMTLTAHFGSGTWSGAWNGGYDGAVHYYTGNSDPYMKGQVGFTANGTISGVNLTSTSVGTNDSGTTVSGSVNGAFFGSNAAAVGGISDITKTYGKDGSYRNVDVFVATQNGPCCSGGSQPQ